jgi:hypothetical protein
MGANVDWDGLNGKVTYTLGDHKVILWIGQARVVIDGEEKEYSPVPFVVDGTTLVPVRLIAEALGFDVSWDASTSTVTVAK